MCGWRRLNISARASTMRSSHWLEINTLGFHYSIASFGQLGVWESSNTGQHDRINFYHRVSREDDRGVAEKVTPIAFRHYFPNHLKFRGQFFYSGAVNIDTHILFSFGLRTLNLHILFPFLSSELAILKVTFLTRHQQKAARKSTC